MNDILVIDQFTIISAAIVFIVALVSLFFSPFLRFKREEDCSSETEESDEDSQSESSGDSTKLPQVSIILTPHDEADILEKNLPILLDQDYPAGYQVIVVLEREDHETEDVVTRLQGQLNEHPGDGSLYMTYILESTRFMSRKKLAMTIGVKAAKTEWVLFTEATTVPESKLWLKTMAKNCNDYTNLILGYGHYDLETSPFKRFERLYTTYYLLREDVKGHAYRTESHNLMVRKSVFMDEEGFRGNLNLIRGEYDFIVNKYAGEDSTALVTDSKAWVTDMVPSRKSWMNKHIFYAETRKWLNGSSKHRFRFNFDQTLLHLSLILSIAGIVVGALLMNIILLAASVVSLIMMIVARTIINHKGSETFNEDLPTMLLYPYELSLIWHNLGYLIRHHFADKLDFTTHKQ